VRFKVWRSNKDKSLHLLCREGSEAFEALPSVVRNMGPWTGSRDGEVDRLRLPYRAILGEQAFVVIFAHVSKLELEAAGRYAWPTHRQRRMSAVQGYWARADVSRFARQSLSALWWAWGGL